MILNLKSKSCPSLVTILAKQRNPRLAIEPMSEKYTQKHTQAVSVEPELQKSNKKRSFNGPPPTHHPKKNAGHLQSYTEAGMILRRSQTYSHQNGSKMNSKKRNLDSKPTAAARLKTL